MLFRHFFPAFVAVTSLLFTPSIFCHGDYHSVVARLGDEIAADPVNTSLRILLAAAHVEHGEWDLCLGELATIHCLAAGVHATGNLAGKALLGKGEIPGALAELDAFLADEPHHQDALASRARALLRAGRAEEAVRDYFGALASPASPELHVEAVEALRRLNRLEEAHRLAEAAVVATAGDPAALMCAVDIAIEAGEIDAAIVHLENLRRTWPRPEPWMMEKARILAEAGRSEESLAAWRELYEHLVALPNLERAQPFLNEAFAASRRALGLPEPAVVVAPPASDR